MINPFTNFKDNTLFTTNKWRLGLGFLAVYLLMLPGCTNEEQTLKSALGYFKDGNIAFRHRDFHNAIWNYRKAIVLDSGTPEFYFNLGLAYYDIGNYPDALDAYLRVAQLRPKLSDTYYNIALAYNRMEESLQADFYYNRYQDMLSLRKAQELLREKNLAASREKTEAAEGTKTVTAVKAIPTATKPRTQGSGIQTHKLPSSSLQFSSPPRSGTRGIPSWE